MNPICLVFLLFVGVISAKTLTKAPAHQKHDDFLFNKVSLAKLRSERKSLGITPIKTLKLEGLPNVKVIFKDESVSKTENSRYRFALSLFTYGLINGYIQQNTTVVEASDGNTAISEAFVAKLLGLDYVVVVPASIRKSYIERIQALGGKVIKATGNIRQRAILEAKKEKGYFLNQYGNSDAVDAPFEDKNIFNEVLKQLKKIPDYYIQTAASGGTISSVGKYIQKNGLKTQVVLADAEYSAYYDYVLSGAFKNESVYRKGPGIEGIGYGGPIIFGETTSLLSSVINQAYKLPDIASIAAMHVLRQEGINGGPTAGVNFLTALSVAANNKSKKPVTIVTVLEDSGYHYQDTYYNLTFIDEKFFKIGGVSKLECYKSVIEHAFKDGLCPLYLGRFTCK